jgi:tetratricopeptide (TPR) repeat protein
MTGAKAASAASLNLFFDGKGYASGIERTGQQRCNRLSRDDTIIVVTGEERMDPLQLRERWLQSINAADLTPEAVAELTDALTQFASLFWNPRELVREAFPPIATLLQRHRQARLYDDVLLTYAAATPYPLARAWALVNVGDSKFGADDFQAAFELLSQARKSFRELRDDEGLAKTMIHLGDLGRFCHEYCDFGERPIDLYRGAIALSKNDTRRQRAYLSLADMYLMANQVDEAINACREALGLSRPHHDIAQRRWTVDALLNLAVSLRSRGRSEEAREIATACKELCVTLNVGESWQRKYASLIATLL